MKGSADKGTEFSEALGQLVGHPPGLGGLPEPASEHGGEAVSVVIRITAPVGIKGSAEGWRCLLGPNGKSRQASRRLGRDDVSAHAASGRAQALLTAGPGTPGRDGPH